MSSLFKNGSPKLSESTVSERESPTSTLDTSSNPCSPVIEDASSSPKEPPSPESGPSGIDQIAAARKRRFTEMRRQLKQSDELSKFWEFCKEEEDQEEEDKKKKLE